ncbi:pyridoxal-5'-phosphate-dependent enzyme [Elsinoe ampelina]|uniref:Pyridoxal-5'-phosphate-dependent enzyme n=1 Tax=Elsinoe ampelina TaxID=302913 RepID=A0A6A6G5Y1_9PEZI|nr:pyridoxal-5'-phosphate-dependent enzyme [Elsinoe ampelina]
MNDVEGYSSKINLEAIQYAYNILGTRAIRTPILRSISLTQLVERPGRINVFLKCENFQRGGSFKFRGACFFLSQLSEETLKKGVVSYSTGNHAIGLALAAAEASGALGYPIPVLIIMTYTASPTKIDKIRALGATVIRAGATLTECTTYAEEVHRETGATVVPTSSHPFNTLGQGTAAVEFLEQMEEIGEGPLDAIIVPSGGASLLAGTAVACHGLQPKLRVFGSEPISGAANLGKARSRGQRITKLEGFTIADGLRQPVAACNWNIVRRKDLVEDCLFTCATCGGARLVGGSRYKSTGMLIEPSSAVPVAALLFNKHLHQHLRGSFEGRPMNIGVIITGGNVSAACLDTLRA